MLTLQTWLVQALFIFLTTESIELKNTSGLMFQIPQRVILPSGHLTLLQGTILIQKIKCIQMAISPM
uniref:Interleukin 6 cytokine family signal transducer n=1 Tax=Saimiri boliviensis boliviensis TaxID=39432 RepID=A0A2K6UU44_SAIBB